MLEETTLVDVTNLSGSPVVYRVPELNVRRVFNKGETKKVAVKELRALEYLPGGNVLIREYLSIANDELLQEFGIIPEPEYHWTEKDVRELLLTGSLARLQDCLDYAPVGVIEQVKDLAVSLQINDMSKRQAILDATGLNVTKAIEINQISKEETEAPEPKTKTRRVSAETTPKAETGRRVAEDVPVVHTKYKRV